MPTTKKNNSQLKLFSTRLLIITMLLVSQFMLTQEEHNYKFISPNLVIQGATIRGTVVEETSNGDMPLNKGDQVIFRGEVIDVEEEGKIELPGYVHEIGNHFITTQIRRAFGTSFFEKPREMIPQHIEILAIKEGLNPQIKQTSEMIGSRRFRVRGQGLLELKTAELVGDNITIPLDEPIASSSLELVFDVPDGEDIQPGEYRFEAKDKDGNSYEAPNKIIKPLLEVYGPSIKKRGQKDEFEIKANVNAYGEILGGEPFIDIPNRFFELKKDETTKVKFVARQVGDYVAKISVNDREEAPVPEGSPYVAEVNVEPIKVVYNGNRTEVITNINVIDNSEVPIKEAPVYMAISYPQGVEYVQIQTNNRGQAKLECSLPGQLSQRVITIHPYKVAGHNWAKQLQAGPEDGDGDDPRDTPKPIIYGEEIENELCTQEFIVLPKPKCKLQKIEIPDIYRGNICYLVFPGSQWEKNSPVSKIIEAQEFYAKYCIYLNFEEIVLSPKNKKKYKKWYKQWSEQLRNKIFPKGHVNELKKKIKAKNLGISKEDLEIKTEEAITEKLKDISIPEGFYTPFYKTMEGLQKAAKKKGCNKTLVVFIDEYICRNPKPTRVSATQLHFNQTGITFLDNGSKNILAHELAHLLGKKPSNGRGSQITWEHNKCTNAVLHTSRGKWWQSYNFADYLSFDEYKIMVKNKAGVKLIKKIN